MRTINLVNIWAYVICLLLFTTIIGGFLAMIPLGVIQITLALVLLSKFSMLNKKVKWYLMIYCALAIVYLTAFFTSFNLKTHLFDFGMPFGIFLFPILPMCIGGFFIVVTIAAKSYELESSTDVMNEDILV